MHGQHHWGGIEMATRPEFTSRLAWTLTIGTHLLLTAAIAQAQSRTSDRNVLEEVMVTAERYGASIQTTPVAVTAISAAALEERAVNNVLEAAEEIPGIVLEPITGSSSAMRVVSRGANQEQAGFRSNATVGVYIDEFIQPRPNGAFFDFFDMERMEFLRGPQGTLYGRNSSGGAMKLYTKRPSLTWTGGAQIAAGNWNQEEAKGYLSGPIVGEKLAFSLSGVKRERDGFIWGLVPNRRVGGLDRRAERLKFLWLPTEKLELNAAITASQDYSEPAVSVPLTVLPGVVNPYAVPGRSLTFSENVGNTDSALNQNMATINATYSWSDALNINSISGYARQKSHTTGELTFSAPEVTQGGNPIPIGSNNDGTGDSKWWSQELNATYDTARLKGVFGLYYFGEKGSTRATSPTSATQDADHEVEAPAVFGQVTYSITDALRVTAGTRYTKETTDFFAFTEGQPAPRVGTSTYKSTTPRFGIDWQVTPQLFTYASYTKGFRAGGFNNRNPVTAEVEVTPYAPEYVDSYEIGGKYQTVDNRFRLNVAIFRAEYEHMHLAVFIPDTSFIVTLPAAGARVEGIELESAWQVIDSLQIYGNLALNSAKYTDPFECTNAHSQRVECSGNEPKGVIPVKSNLGIRFRPDLGWLPGQLSLNASWAHNDMYYNNVANELDIVQTPQLDLYNATLSWSDASGRWNVAVEGRNLADKIYRQAGLQTSNPIQPAVVAYPGPRRTVIARVGINF